MRRIRSKITYANTISTICLFLLLGGGAAFAAIQLPQNSVGPGQLRSGAVTGPKIKNRAVTTNKLSASAIRALSANPLQVVTVEGATLVLGPGGFGGAPTAQCPSGYAVVGTGFYGGVAQPGFVLGFGTFVGGFFINESGIVTESNVQAICGKTRGGATASNADALVRFNRKVEAAEAALTR